MSTSALRAELQRREADAQTLLKRQTELAAQLKSIEEELAALGVTSVGGRASRKERGPGRPRGSKNKTTTKTKAAKSTARRGGRRAKKKMSLVVALQKMLSNKTMSVAEAAKPCRMSGTKRRARTSARS